MSKGKNVVYTAHDEHLTETKRGEEVLKGSLHHPEHSEFAGIITGLRANGNADLIIFPPNRDPKHVDDVPHSSTAKGHSFRHVDAPAKDDGKK